MVEIHSFFEKLLDGDKQAILIAASTYFILMGLMSLIYQLRVKSWPMTVGTLETAEISRWGVPRPPSDQTYATKVEYTYTVNGEHYTGKRLSPWQIFVTYNLKFVIKWQMSRIIKTSADEVTVFYNPASPDKSYLIKPNTTSIITTIILFGLPAVLLLLEAGL